MSRIDELQRMHEMYGRRHAMLALFDAWPAIHRVLVAARGLVGSFRSDTEEWNELVEALRALDAHQD